MEVQIYLAKFLPNPRRGEPRNVGLVVRTAMDDVLHKFVLEGERPANMSQHLDFVNAEVFEEYSKTIMEWKAAFEKYGVKALLWVGKRKTPQQRFYLEFSGGEMMHLLNFDELFKELVL